MMTAKESAELRDRRKTAPQNEPDVQKAIEETATDLKANFERWDELEKTAGRLQRSAFKAIAGARFFGGLGSTELFNESKVFMPYRLWDMTYHEFDDFLSKTEAQKGPRIFMYSRPDPKTDEERAQRAKLAAECKRDSVRWALAGDSFAGCEEEWISNGQEWMRPLADQLEDLRCLIVTLQGAFQKLRDSIPADGAVFGLSGPKRKTKIARWTAKAIADRLLQSNPPWTEDQLANLFASLAFTQAECEDFGVEINTPVLSTRDKVHDLLWNGPGGTRAKTAPQPKPKALRKPVRSRKPDTGG